MRENLKITTSYMVCPACMEPLLREDIEGFGRCPYCDHAFDLSPALEDFLLSPVIRQWVNHTHARAQEDSPIND